MLTNGCAELSAENMGTGFGGGEDETVIFHELLDLLFWFVPISSAE